MKRVTEALRWQARAETALRAGDRARAIECLRQAVALHAIPAASEEREPSDDLGRATVCQHLAEILVDAERLPEALQTFQEAADAYGRVPGAEEQAQECARRILAGVKELRRRPQERLFLLIAQIERDQRQLAASYGTEKAQADCAFRAATILQRRDRYAEAIQRYQEALALYRRAPEAGMEEATCHHRLAGLYHHEQHDLPCAIEHYRQAIELYRQFEPISEGEQMNRVLCEWLLENVMSALTHRESRPH